MSKASDANPAAFTTVLRLALVLQCVGAVGIALREGGQLEQGAAMLALAAALVFAWRGVPAAAWIVVAVFFADGVLDTFSGAPFAFIAIPAHAARYGIAIALLMPAHAGLILRVCASMTFFGHGIEALGLHPKFLAYIQHASALVGIDTTQSATAILRVIGSIDLVVAVAVLRRGPQPFVAGYMSVWGTITALARTVYAGPAGLPDTLVRAANAAAPFALWLGWRRRG